MNYYVINNELFDDSQFAYGTQKKENSNFGNAKICSSCGRFVSMLEWLPPFEVIVSRKELGDFIYGSYVGFIVSKNFKEKFESSHLNGLTKFQKVDLFYGKKLLNEEYYYPDICMINAFVDLSYMDFDEKDSCNECQVGKGVISKIDGIVFNNPNKINKDIFTTTSVGQSIILFSENFKKFIEVESFTNLFFLDSAKFKWDSLNPVDC